MTSKPVLLETVRHVMRTRHMSLFTEGAYVRWISVFLRFVQDRDGLWKHPRELSSPGVSEFLSYLAVKRQVAASTQNQAYSAIVFRYRKVLDSAIQIDAVRAQKPERLPVVLSRDEVWRVLAHVPNGPFSLMAAVMYGARLRLMEMMSAAVSRLGLSNTGLMSVPTRIRL